MNYLYLFLTLNNDESYMTVVLRLCYATTYNFGQILHVFQLCTPSGHTGTQLQQSKECHFAPGSLSGSGAKAFVSRAYTCLALQTILKIIRSALNGS